MDTTLLIALVIVAGLTALAVSALLCNNVFRNVAREESRRDEKVDTIQKTIDSSLVRLMKLEDKVFHTPEDQGDAKKDDKEDAGKPVTPESVCTALRHNGFSPEIPDKNDTPMVNFKINDTSFRIDTSRLPFLVLELGYSLNPAEEDVELMRRAAAEITAGIFIGKVNILSDGQVVVFTAEWICDSFPQLRDTFNQYIDIVVEAHKRFFESYKKMREEKRKMEEELASKPFTMAGGADTGTKLLS